MENKKASTKKVMWIVVFAAAILVFAAAALFLIRTWISGNKTPDPDDYVSTTEAQYTTSSAQVTEPPLPDNPVDFAALNEENEDIYAWIRIPGTGVDYPVLQSREDDLYYLRRAYDKSYSVSGCIFTQSLNSKDFSDRNTLIYGHYMTDGTFFGSLHNFRDEDFFNEHEDIYIYTPGHILKYRIFAAYEYDDRHILNSFDFSDDQVYSDYLASCLNPKSVNRNVRQGVQLDTDNKIVTLSTCTSLGYSTLRYLVQGVLVSDEQTK